MADLSWAVALPCGMGPDKNTDGEINEAVISSSEAGTYPKPSVGDFIEWPPPRQRLFQIDLVGCTEVDPCDYPELGLWWGRSRPPEERVRIDMSRRECDLLGRLLQKALTNDRVAHETGLTRPELRAIYKQIPWKTKTQN